MKWMVLAFGLFLGACSAEVFDCESPDLYRPCDELITAWAQEEPESRGASEGFWDVRFEFYNWCAANNDPICEEVRGCEDERALACKEEE